MISVLFLFSLGFLLLIVFYLDKTSIFAIISLKDHGSLMSDD